MTSQAREFGPKVDLDRKGTLSWEQKPELSLFWEFNHQLCSGQLTINQQMCVGGCVCVFRPSISDLPSLLPPCFASLNYNNLGGTLKIAE